MTKYLEKKFRIKLENIMVFVWCFVFGKTIKFISINYLSKIVWLTGYLMYGK